MKELRAKNKLLSEKVLPDISEIRNTFNSFNLANTAADDMRNNVFQNAINSVPAKDTSGRPHLHVEERQFKALTRNWNAIETMKPNLPKIPVGRPREHPF